MGGRRRRGASCLIVEAPFWGPLPKAICRGRRLVYCPSYAFVCTPLTLPSTPTNHTHSGRVNAFPPKVASRLARLSQGRPDDTTGPRAGIIHNRSSRSVDELVDNETSIKEPGCGLCSGGRMVPRWMGRVRGNCAAASCCLGWGPVGAHPHRATTDGSVLCVLAYPRHMDALSQQQLKSTTEWPCPNPTHPPIPLQEPRSGSSGDHRPRRLAQQHPDQHQQWEQQQRQQPQQRRATNARPRAPGPPAPPAAPLPLR